MEAPLEEKPHLSVLEQLQELPKPVEGTNGSGFIEGTPAERRLLWKIDLYLMPTIWLLYMFSYMDRTNIGNAKVAGMQEFLNLSSSQYYLAVVLFQVGYSIFGFLSNIVLARWKPSLWIPLMMILWGTVAASLAAIQTTTQLLALRFLLGVVESGFSPAVTFIISAWYRKHEQSKRFVVWLSAAILAGAFGGLVAGGIADSMDGRYGIAGWRWLFLVEGVSTVGVAIITPFFLLNYPLTSSQLTPAQRQLAFDRLQADGITSREEGDDRSTKSLVHAVTDWRVWFLGVAYMTIVGSLSLSYFYPTLVHGLGYSATTAQFMTAPLYVCAVVIAVPVCIFVDRIPDYRGASAFVVLVGGAMFCALGAGIYAYVPRYVFLCFINSAIWTANPLALSFATTSMAEVQPETRAIAVAIINACGNLAQLYGSAVFPAEDAPKYLTGFGVYSGLMFLGACLYLSAHFLFRKYPFKARW